MILKFENHCQGLADEGGSVKDYTGGLLGTNLRSSMYWFCYIPLAATQSWGLIYVFKKLGGVIQLCAQEEKHSPLNCSSHVQSLPLKLILPSAVRLIFLKDESVIPLPD